MRALCWMGLLLVSACGDSSAQGGAGGADGGNAGASVAGGGSGGGSGGDGGGLSFDGVDEKPVIYQLVVRTFGNTNLTRQKDGTLAENGSGKFADINDAALTSLRDLGVTHVWLTGVLRQATLTDYSDLGMAPDDPDTVKGIAGSFYAVRDYYDVSPDYALDPEARLAEFEALVSRAHDAGLKVMIDLVPNHVARGYGSVVFPERDFGVDDDQAAFFSPSNNFYYLADPPGQALTLTRPASWSPSGLTFDGAFFREDGGPSRTPRATGNNVTSPSPSATDWYETVKLNYGRDFVTGASDFEPLPDTWTKIDAIVAYWQSVGVDGFRADFAHYVPNEAWRYLLEQARTRDPSAYFVAEAYDDLEGLLGAGFDAVYHDAATDTVKRLYLGQANLDSLGDVLGALDDPTRGRYLHYLENHDERRVASPIVAGSDPDASGFGSPAAGRQLAPLLYLLGNGPVLLHAGQELGETGAGDEGFGGEDGRTSIFDYTALPSLQGWMGDHAFDGAGMSDDERSLRDFYGDLLTLSSSRPIRGNRYFGLRYANLPSEHPDASGAFFSFARYGRGESQAMIVVTNLGVGGASGVLRLPAEFAQALEWTGDVTLARVFDERGLVDPAEPAFEGSLGALAETGFSIDMADQSSAVYALSEIP